jgi:hypothetical protein
MIAAPLLQPQITAIQALDVARAFVADRLTDLMGTGIPWRMRSPFGGVWVVPIWIAYPGYDQPGTVGSVAVDEATGNIVSWTPVDEALANAEQFHERYFDSIQVGFRALGEANSG